MDHPDNKHKYITLTTYDVKQVQAAVPLPGEKCNLCGRKVPKAKKAN